MKTIQLRYEDKDYSKFLAHKKKMSKLFEKDLSWNNYFKFLCVFNNIYY